MAVWINEFHYDNSGTDEGEFIELAGPAGLDLTGWKLYLYNGNGGMTYGDPVALDGTIPDQSDGFGTVLVSFPSNGLQNGAPDGFALVDPDGTVVEFLSYEGTLTAVGGPADGMTSVDVGVSESSGTAVGASLQRTGEGVDGSQFTFTGPAPASPGQPNVGQTFDGLPPPPPPPPAPEPGLTLVSNVIGTLDLGGAEIVAYDPETLRFFVTSGDGLSVVDASDPTNPVQIALLAPGTAINSVAISDGLVAVAVPADDRTDDGQVLFFDAGTLEFRGAVEVGPNPDHLAFDETGRRLMVVNEGESSGADNEPGADANPNGSISIIKVNDKKPGNSAVTELDFRHPSITFDALEAAGIRVNRDAPSAAADLEPEYITIDGRTAYVSLQENNAILTIEDIFNPRKIKIDDFKSLGTQDHSVLGSGLDASNEDGGIRIATYDIEGLKMADQIATIEVDGRTYILTANEGDGRGIDESRGLDLVDGDLSNGEIDATEVSADLQAQLADEGQLGRLKFSNVDGDVDGDGLIEDLYSFGGRSFSIYDAETGALVFDSGDDLEQITAAAVPELFNSNGDAGTFDQRSDDKGPEPEAITVGMVGDSLYAFIALERTGGIVVYDVTDPSNATFEQYVAVDGDVAPEGLSFIPADQSPTGTALLAVANEESGTLSFIEFSDEPTPIYAIQGASQTSPLEGRLVRTEGIVTAVDSNGFYLQDAEGDGNVATSDALFVFTGSRPTVAVGDAITVDGTVSEFGFPGELTTTQVSSVTRIVVESSGNDLPAAVVIGGDGRAIPTESIDDSPGTFDPEADGLDFFESLEAMRVTASDLIAVSGTNRFGEIFAVSENYATGLSERGTLNISPDDFNPERIQIDEDSGVFNFDFPDVDTGAYLGDVTGVVGYGFGNFEIIPTEDFTDQIIDSTLVAETSAITGGPGVLSFATYNVLNLDPSDGDQFAVLAAQIVGNLNAPYIIALQEIQDNTGPTNDGTVSADLTLSLLSQSIYDLSGIEYEWIDNTFITDNASGGQPGANIRTAYLYNDAYVDLVDGSVGTIGGQGDGEAFEGARLPLVATFEYEGEAFTFVNVHLSSKGGSAALMGPEQPFEERQEDVTVNGSLDERRVQAEAIADFVEGELAADPDANLIVLGDFNEFEFVSPLEILEGAGLTKLTNTLPEDERYSYIFQGNSQSLDHILVSDALVAGAEFDAVHVNSEFADGAASDHDPLLASVLVDEFAFL